MKIFAIKHVNTVQACRGMDHLNMLAQLTPADRQAARELMRNLITNLHPEFMFHSQPTRAPWELSGTRYP